MEELRPEEWAYWQASYRCDPWGDDWERTSVNTVELINSLQMLAHGLGGGKGDVPKPIPGDALVPFRVHVDEELQDALLAVDALEGMRGL